MIKALLKNKIINNLCVRIINAIIPIKSVRQDLRKQLKYILLEDLKYNFSKLYQDYYQFVMFHPWGDFYIASALLAEFKKHHQNAKILAICKNESQKKVLETFDAIDKIKIVSKEFYHAILSIDLFNNFKQELKVGTLYCLSHWNYHEAEQNKSMNFLELYQKMLGIKHPSKFELLKLKTYAKNNETNTILIYPEANSFDCREFSKDFWISLVDKLTSMGYNVVLNSKKQNYGRYETIFLPIIESIEFAQNCKYIIGTRSGFSDILAINEIKNHIVLYPKSMYFKTITKEQQEKAFKRAFVMEENKTFEENMKRITSLKMFNNSAKEIYYTDEKTIMNEILEDIKEKN